MTATPSFLIHPDDLQIQEPNRFFSRFIVPINPDQAEAMGKSSLAHLCSEFAYSVMRRRWFAAFDSILRGSRHQCAALQVI